MQYYQITKCKFLALENYKKNWSIIENRRCIFNLIRGAVKLEEKKWFQLWKCWELLKERMIKRFFFFIQSIKMCKCQKSRKGELPVAAYVHMSSSTYKPFIVNLQIEKTVNVLIISSSKALTLILFHFFIDEINWDLKTDVFLINCIKRTFSA